MVFNRYNLFQIEVPDWRVAVPFYLLNIFLTLGSFAFAVYMVATVYGIAMSARRK